MQIVDNAWQGDRLLDQIHICLNWTKQNTYIGEFLVLPITMICTLFTTSIGTGTSCTDALQLSSSFTRASLQVSRNKYMFRSHFIKFCSNTLLLPTSDKSVYSINKSISHEVICHNYRRLVRRNGHEALVTDTKNAILIMDLFSITATSLEKSENP